MTTPTNPPEHGAEAHTAPMLKVRFISFYAGRTDYGVERCFSHLPETRISTDAAGGVLPHTFADRMQSEHGFTFEEASIAVREFAQRRFDDEVRCVVAKNLTDYADTATVSRARELGLIPA